MYTTQQTLANLPIVSTVDSVPNITSFLPFLIACDKSGTGYGGFVKMHTFVLYNYKSKDCFVKSTDTCFVLFCYVFLVSIAMLFLKLTSYVGNESNSTCGNAAIFISILVKDKF